MPVLFAIDPSLDLVVGLLDFNHVRVTEDDGPFRQLEQCAAAYRDRFPGGSPSDVPEVAHARRLFRLLGIDPTRRRPSSEAMLMRALKSKPLPRINTIVDVGNWSSLECLLPLGLYDRGRLSGPVELRPGLAGESYPAIGNKVINLEDRYLLADAEGPFGSPMTDSRRTATSVQTTAAFIVLYAPPDYDRGRFEHHLDQLAERTERYCGATTTRREVLAL